MRLNICQDYVARPSSRLLTTLAISRLVGMTVAPSVGPAMAETLTAGSDEKAMPAPSVPCERQTSPYVDNACAGASGKTSKPLVKSV
jgi:hypothetical protein